MSTRPGAANDVFMTLFSAALFLYVGFGRGLVGISGDWLYDQSVAVFVWGCRIVGIGLVIVAGLIGLRLPGAVTIDLVMSVLATLLTGVVGAIWLFHADLMNGFLLLLFTMLNANVTRNAWLRWQATRPASDAGDWQDAP
jgi:hypothetical protein